MGFCCFFFSMWVHAAGTVYGGFDSVIGSLSAIYGYGIRAVLVWSSQTLNLFYCLNILPNLRPAARPAASFQALQDCQGIAYRADWSATKHASRLGAHYCILRYSRAIRSRSFQPGSHTFISSSGYQELSGVCRKCAKDDSPGRQRRFDGLLDGNSSEEVGVGYGKS